jgi:integrase
MLELIRLSCVKSGLGFSNRLRHMRPVLPRHLLSSRGYFPCAVLYRDMAMFPGCPVVMLKPNASTSSATRVIDRRRSTYEKNREKKAEVRKKAVHAVARESFLRDSSVKLSTRLIYKAAVDDFEQFLRRSGTKPPTTPLALDDAMEDYFSEMYFNGHSPATGRNAMHGYLLFRCPRWSATMLAKSKRAMKGWLMRNRGMVGKPCPEAAMLLLANVYLIDERPLMAAMVVVQFDAYLRPSEALALQKCDVVPPIKHDPVFGAKWGILLAPQESGRTTKTGKTDGSIDVGGHIRPYAKEVLAAVYENVPDGPLFEPVSLGQYECSFHCGMKEAELEQLQLTPHTLRHGGPSIDRATGDRTLADIKKRGQWATMDSVARYEKEVVLQRQVSLMTTNQRSQAMNLKHNIAARIASMLKAQSAKNKGKSKRLRQ